VFNRQYGCGKKALVVGAGPGGLLTALFLAQRGYQVDVSHLACRTNAPPTNCNILKDFTVHLQPEFADVAHTLGRGGRERYEDL
jgi:NADPH-dependent 2,4-dienoyl-CoA reductase/sulfur reductase-like enzyme